MKSSTPTLRPQLACVALLLVACLMSACGQLDSGVVELNASVRQITGYTRASPASPALWIIVVDDAPTPEGRAVRTQVAQELSGSINRLRDDTCVRARDHAVFYPMNLQVLVVPSSDPSQALHVGIDENLALVTDNGTSEGNAAWELAVATAVMGMESEQVLPNRLLDAWSHWADVLSGRRLASRSVDSAFVQQIVPETGVSLFAATSRDDMSEGPQGAFDYGPLDVERRQVLINNEQACLGLPLEELAPALWNQTDLRSCDDTLFDWGAVCDVFSTCNGGEMQVDEWGRRLAGFWLIQSPVCLVQKKLVGSTPWTNKACAWHG